MELSIKNGKFIVTTDNIDVVNQLLLASKKVDNVATVKSTSSKPAKGGDNTKRKKLPNSTKVVKEFVKNNPDAKRDDIVHFLKERGYSQKSSEETIKKLFK